MEIEVRSEREIRLTVVRLLADKGYKVESIAEGSGSPEFSQIVATRGAERLLCAIKITTQPHGRISFTRAPTGRWKVLDNVNYVIHAWQKPSSRDQVCVSMFEKEIIREAFELNFAAKRQHAMEQIPSWIGPIYEPAWRFTGSGFGDKAIWTERVSLSPQGSQSNQKADDAPTSSEEPGLGIMDRIKQMLSEHMGVRPELIEIDVRVKL
ncbi:hypothetical protein [Ancylobacter novellus]|nr:hypothetical protein [Ancylobacter novellus]